MSRGGGGVGGDDAHNQHVDMDIYMCIPALCRVQTSKEDISKRDDDIERKRAPGYPFLLFIIILDASVLLGKGIFHELDTPLDNSYNLINSMVWKL